MCRHCKARWELYGRIKQGQIGDITTLRSYRLVGPVGFTGPKPSQMSELLYQIQRYLGFLWASGGVFHDFVAHNVDECCWMKDAWPVRADGMGSRCYRGDAVDQNFDHYSMSTPLRMAPNSSSIPGTCPVAARNSPAMLMGPKARR